ncbi:hypothetical protein O181_010781 [Austropuccinia psidii MF-1]|uniref:Uncharacterized protein n=1 Tax=Austropuccinia psidii MF-1 TaxID=1389203 RepID=A0A9Q3BUH6_9BASI|nr:hypothetical protein [Austropuccinia psidii MF-1]
MPAVPQLRAPLDRGPNIEGEAQSRKERRGPRGSSPGGDDGGEEENSVEEEEHDSTEAAPTPVGASQGAGRPTLSQSNQNFYHHSVPSLLAIMQQMIKIMENIQADSSSEVKRPPALKTLSMKAPDCFDGIQPFKVRSFIYSCQLIFHKEEEDFSEDRKKVLYANSFLIGRAVKCIEPYLSNLINLDPEYLLNNRGL